MCCSESFDLVRYLVELIRHKGIKADIDQADNIVSYFSHL
jgi:hypothetical protein